MALGLAVSAPVLRYLPDTNNRLLESGVSLVSGRS